MEIANSAAELFPHMQNEEKRELISLVLSNPVIEDANVRYDYKKPFDMFVDMENIEKWRAKWDEFRTWCIEDQSTNKEAI